MADPGSSLAAALATGGFPHFDDEQQEAAAHIWAAARERLRLSRIPCFVCDGDGKGARLGGEVLPCGECGGSGEVWPEELVEAVARAMEPWIDVDPAVEEYHLARHHNAKQAARAVLDALDLHAKGGQ